MPPTALRLAALCALPLLAACAAPERERFTLAEQLSAAIPGIPDARAWGDAGPDELALLGMAPEEVAARRSGPLDYLALSSGGPAGAFGAGLLVGWTASGTRPEFDVVTGVSSGALLAPFAFVGPEGDAALRALWRGGLAAGIADGLNPVGLLTGDGLLDPEPLRGLVEAYVDDALVAAIARGHLEGRRLLVMTTNLDAQRPVIWNLGAIAASGRPEAAGLIRQVLIASATVPVAMAPALIEAVAGSRLIHEMHVDGGVSRQVFAIPDAAMTGAATGITAGAGSFAVPSGREATLWLVVNYVLGPEFAVTPGGTVGVGSRAYGTLIKSDIGSELQAMAYGAREAGMALRVVAITETVPWDPRDPFGPAFMGTLFDLGTRRALAGMDVPENGDGRS